MILDRFSKQIGTLNKIAGVLTSITLIAGAYYYYRTTIWRPTVKILNVDWDKGQAKIQIGNNKVISLQKNQTFAIGGDFGLRFSGNTDDSIDRIELYKNFLTYQVIIQKTNV